MSTVNVSIGHDDDAVVAGSIRVEILTDIRTDSGNERRNGVGRKRAVQASALDVQNLTAQGHDGLIFAVASLFSRPTCGIALNNKDFGIGRILARTVSQLSRQAERIKNTLTARHLARFTSSLTGLQCLRGLVDDALSRRGVLFKILSQALSYGSLNQATNFRIAQLALGLTLELRVAEFN